METPTNWFVGYAMFHPRDWSEVCFPFLCHENDLGGVLLTIRRDGSPFGEFPLMSTIFLDTVHGYTDFDQAPSSGVTGFVDGDVQFLAGSHPIVYIEAKGHGITGAERWDDGIDNDGDTIIDEADEGYTAASFTPPPLDAPFGC